MTTPDLLDYLRERLVERLTEETSQLTAAEAELWFDTVIESWVHAHPSSAEEEAPAGERPPRSAEGLSKLEVRFETDAGTEPAGVGAEIPTYDPPPAKRALQVSPIQFWMRIAHIPWPDLPLEEATEVFTRHLVFSVAHPPLTYENCQLGWESLDEVEARALAFELYRARVDLQALLAEIEAYPYPKISFAWFTRPEHSLQLHARLIAEMDEELRTEDPASAAHLRHNTEFIGRLADLIPPQVRIWLQGWSAAREHAALARAVGLEPGVE
jgi:hypothetical protein